MVKRGIVKVVFGGWYQRTTLHLSEVFHFFSEGTSLENFPKDQLLAYRDSLNLVSAQREFGNLEKIKAITKEGIKITYYEDGLYLLEIASSDVKKSKQILSEYYEKRFAPAINYIFSLGAPTPKILSNIRYPHSIIVEVLQENSKSYSVDPRFGRVYSKISYRDFTVSKTKDYIFIVLPERKQEFFEPLNEMQIFFREFKQQLWKYLRIHRKVWEEIDRVIETGKIRGKEISERLGKLRSYRRTVGLIRNRINQMDTYVNTRSSLSKYLKVDEPFRVLFEYRFEDLTNTLGYIKELWSATIDYVDSAISTLQDLENSASERNLESIKIIASVGVISLVLGYLAAENYPAVTLVGVISLLGFAVAAWLIDFIIKLFAENRNYEIVFDELETSL